ncbi:MAG: NADH-quinone oxidoreductase subunit L [Acidimicrobiaceae bacterium]|nr:NADH-quinone oxidoreductase subunit L [Acidimicrobiaceae bacterium]MCY4279482.1 NADH-quinone oxidoreductase subunit L [Acidimicrobiaceae bacterium]
MLDAAWLICAFPLAGFVLLVLFGRRLGEPAAGWLATAAMTGAFAAAAAVFFALMSRDAADRRFVVTLFEWIPAGDFAVDAGLLIDPLSVTMALFVTGVGALIHVYAIGYMHGDGDFAKFFTYLNLFAFSMLVLVLGDNLVLTFLGWEGVGACSYLLISFWFSDEANAAAGKKAFITNRVGDWGFMLAIFWCFAALGSVRYLDLFGVAGSLSSTTATVIVVLLFAAAAGKSAQLPLFIWLPDAMAGPTPVSALIHAATMVTAGVYLLVRVNPLIAAADSWAPELIAWAGAGTALFAAAAATAQNDIKKVLAYSTVSQLGYMMLAVGSGAYVAAVFHMVTHAFFKALLFLGAGSVIHALHHKQDMRGYGALRAAMPITAGTFIVGWLAIAGVPPFAGFWSKDEILAHAWDHSVALWLVGIVTAVLTAFYMSRLVFMTFFGQSRHAVAAGIASGDGSASDVDVGVGSGSEPHEPPHEPSALMTAPLVVLAGAAAVAGFINLPFSSELHFLGDWLAPSLFGNEAHLASGAATQWLLAVVSLAGAALGIAVAAAVYLRQRLPARRFERPAAARAFYFDELWTRFVGGPGRRGFEAVAAFDAGVIDGAVNGVGRSVRAAAVTLRRAQSGFVRSYALLTAAGAVALLVWFLIRASV